jgi:photosynthetic reaction center H subunit
MRFFGTLDFAQIAIWLFWVFFFSLIYYLRREDKREGYPLVGDRPGVKVEGWPAVPPKKQYLESHKGEHS